MYSFIYIQITQKYSHKLCRPTNKLHWISSDECQQYWSWTICVRVFGFFLSFSSEATKSSMHNFLPLAMCTIGKMQNTDVNPYCHSSLLTESHDYIVYKLLNSFLNSNLGVEDILRLYSLHQSRKILRIIPQMEEIQITAIYT